jgi:signal transduction histidine kinase
MSEDRRMAIDALRSALLNVRSSVSPEDASQMLEQLDELSLSVELEREERRQFVSHVSHELRVPMTSIMGYTDLLRKGIFGPVNDQQLNFLNIIRSNVDRMAALVSDLSDLSKLETGSLVMEIVACRLQDVVDGVVRNLQPAFADRNQHFTTTLPADMPHVSADTKRLAQVLTNLLNNANRYTPPGGSISVHVTRDERMARLEVSDTGIGISSEDQSRLFEQFFRSDHAAVREHPGWGLSLSVSKGLVEQMGGAMGAASKPGEGCTFWFTVPLIVELKLEDT